MEIDQLLHARTSAATAFTYTGLVTDLIELLLTVLTLIYATLRHIKQKKANPNHRASKSVTLQMILQFVQSLLFTTEKVYQAYTGIVFNYKDKLPKSIYTCQLLGMPTLMMSHALFVGQYARIAVAIPLTFCAQNDEIKHKLKWRLRMVLFCELLCLFYLAAQFIYEYKSQYGFYLYWICLSVPATILAIALGVVFYKLQVLNKQMEGIFCDAKLMCFHYAAFVTATVFDDAVFAMNTAGYFLDERDQRLARVRVEIALYTFAIFQTLAWFVC